MANTVSPTKVLSVGGDRMLDKVTTLKKGIFLEESFNKIVIVSHIKWTIQDVSNSIDINKNTWN